MTRRLIEYASRINYFLSAPGKATAAERRVALARWIDREVREAHRRGREGRRR